MPVTQRAEPAVVTVDDQHLPVAAGPCDEGRRGGADWAEQVAELTGLRRVRDQPPGRGLVAAVNEEQVAVRRIPLTQDVRPQPGRERERAGSWQAAAGSGQAHLARVFRQGRRVLPGDLETLAVGG